MTAIALDDVSKEYPGGVVALDRVSVEVADGERVAIVGPVGLGQDDDADDHGHARASERRARVRRRPRVDGASDAQLAGLRAHRLGFVFQTFHLQETLSALDNVANGTALHRRASRPSDAKPHVDGARPRRPRRPHVAPPITALGRRAPAGRDRPRDRQAAADRARRRADRQPRLEVRWRGHRAPARARGRRRDASC